MKTKKSIKGRRTALGYAIKKLLGPVSDSVKAEVKEVARQVAGQELALSPADISQLSDLAQCCQRIEDGTEMAKAVKMDDPALWLRITGKIQADVSLKRALLRDLKITRQAAAGQKKQRKPDGGSDWSGIL